MGYVHRFLLFLVSSGGTVTGVNFLIYILIIHMFLLFEFSHKNLILLDFHGCVFEVLTYYLGSSENSGKVIFSSDFELSSNMCLLGGRVLRMFETTDVNSSI